MVQIYLTGAVSNWDKPFKWHDELEADERYSEHTFINPYTLNDFDLGDDEIYERPAEVVEPALAAVRESDAMLVRWDDDAFLIGTAMEMKEAWEAGIPIAVWYDGYRDNLSPWILHTTKGSWEDKDTALKVLLALCGDTDALHK